LVSLAVETRKVDSKGRIYLSSRLKGRVVYLVSKGDLLVVATSRERLQEAVRKLYGKSILEEYLDLLAELGEPTPKEVEKLARVGIWRKLEGHS